MTDQQAPNSANTSGGVNLNSEQTDIGGDVVGRDNIITDTRNSGNQQTMNFTNGGIVAVAIVAIVMGLAFLALMTRASDINSGPSATTTTPPWTQATSGQLPGAGNLVKQFDLDTAITGWKDVIQLDAGWNNGQTFKNAAIPASAGESGLGYDLRLNAGSWLNHVIRYPEPVQADVIVARFYLPDSRDLDQNWLGLQATEGAGGPLLARSATPITPGEWTLLVLDLRDKYDTNDVPLRSRPINLEVFYSLKGKAKLTTDTVRARLADVAWYKDAGAVTGIQSEQRGGGHVLFDFENERLDWQVSPRRVPTDTVELAYGSAAHRGKAFLKLNTHLANGENAFALTVLNKFVPRGGWIANVYLPDEPPQDTRIWANLYTYSQSDWQDSPTTVLKKGWNTLLWDTHAVNWGDKTSITVGLQIGAEGGEYNGPIYIDDVQVFEQ